MAGLGIENPASTSGHMGYNEKVLLNKSEHVSEYLPLPSYRTASPNKHRLNPMLIGNKFIEYYSEKTTAFPLTKTPYSQFSSISLCGP